MRTAVVIRLNTGAKEPRADTPSNQNPGQGRVEKANQGKMVKNSIWVWTFKFPFNHGP